MGSFSPDAVVRLVAHLSPDDARDCDIAPIARTPCLPPPHLFALGVALVEKNLVQPLGDIADQPRFRLLDTIRDFALEQLAICGEEANVRTAHAHAYISLAESVQPHLRGADQASWFTQLETEQGNLRAALDWLVARGELVSALRLANALARFWEARGHLAEGRWRFQTLLDAADAPSSPPVPPSVRARAELWSGTLAHWQGDYRDAIASYQTAFKRYQAAGNDLGAAHALLRHGQSATFLGDLETARSLIHESLQHFERIGDAWGIASARTALAGPSIEAGELDHVDRLLRESLPVARQTGDVDLVAMTLINVGWLAWWRGEDARAEAALQESHNLFQQIGERRTLPFALNLLGRLAWQRGDASRAHQLLAESIALSRDLGSRLPMIDSFMALAAIAHQANRPEVSARLLGAAESARNVIGVPLQPVEQPVVDSTMASLRETLGVEGLHACFAIGMSAGAARMSTDALTFLDELASVAEQLAPERAAVSLLTRREREILSLIVEGRSNPEIAASLFISPKTVRNHVTNILAKFGVESRTAAATFAIRNHLV